MALGNYIQAEGTGHNGDSYRVTILKEGYLSDIIGVEFGPGMFEIRYEPITDDISTPVIPSSVSLYFYEQDGTQRTAFDDLLTSQLSTDFAVFIERDAGTTGVYTDYWRGLVMQDQMSFQDSSRPNVVQIECIDGLGYGQYVDFDLLPRNASPPANTAVNDTIIDALKLSNNTDLWAASDTFLTISVDWWEDTQTYSATGDPTDGHFFNPYSFNERKQREAGYFVTEVPTVLEALAQFAYVYFARIYQSNGRYVFEQVELRTSDTVKQVDYSKSNSFLGGGLNSVATTLDQTRQKARLSGGVFNHLPALKEVEAEIKSYGSQYDNEVSIDASDYTDSATEDFGYFDKQLNNIGPGTTVAQSFTFAIDFLVNVLWDWVAGDVVTSYGGALAGNIAIRPRADLEIKLTAINSANVYYWDEAGQQWTTTATTITVFGAEKVIGANATTGSGTINYLASNITQYIKTDQLPETAVLELTLDNYSIEYLTALPDTWAILSTADPDASGFAGEVNVSFKTELSRSSAIRVVNALSSNTLVGDNQVYKYPTILIRDGSLQNGCIFINNAGTYEAADSWNVANGSDALPLNYLMVRNRLQLQRATREVWDGNVQYETGYGTSLNFDSGLFIPMQVTFLAAQGVMTGRWFRVAEESESNAPTEINPADNYQLEASSNEASFGKGKMGGLISSPYGNLMHGMAYDPDAEIYAVPAPQLMNKGQRNNTELIDAESAGSSASTTTSTVALFSWVGAAGTHAHEIPDADDMDGAVLEFITDDSFTGSETVEITPAAGNIQGAATFEITSANTHYFFRAIRGNWY